jgi:hypothetical protein
VLLLLLVAVSLTGVILSCASSPEAGEQQCPPKPGWISDPEQEGYYVGVGSADTGTRAEDRPVAEARARADLASRISANIRSELEIATSESTAEGASQEVSENVTQSVEANLQDIETVDTYHCPGEGTWVYVRLSRMRWEEIQAERRAELIERLRELVEPVLESDDEDFLLELETLQQGRTLVYESSVGPSVSGTIAGEKGNLGDLLTKFINRDLSSLSLSVERERVEVPAGEELSFSGRLSSPRFDRTGNVEIFVDRKSGGRLTTVQTDERGNFTVQIPRGFDEPGEQHVVLRPSFPEYEGEGLLSEDTLPTQEVVFAVQRVQVGLVVETSSEVSGVDFSRQVKSLFSERGLPLEIVEDFGSGSDLSLVIRFLVRIKDFPKLSENALSMAQARAVVSFEREGKTLYSHETKPLKDGGITADQAHQRVADKLFSTLEENDELFRTLEESIITR